MTIVIIVATTTTAMLIGMVLGRITMLDRINALELMVLEARRHSGRLGNRIGKQRVKIRTLKAQLKSVATSVSAVAPPMHRNLPH